jgi:predicted aconitase
MELVLSADERAILQGAAGGATRLAMRILVEMARIEGAQRLIEVTRAHVDGGLYHGPAGLDFALRLVDGGARVAVPTTLNVSSLDLLHPHLFRGDPATAAAARRLMDAYRAMGCEPTWTCAPYQLPRRPAFGEQIAWAESNAIVFANSVLGARTERYGDFIDICAAITGRVPDAGLHRTENRHARIVFRLTGVSDRTLDDELLYPVLGHLVGRASDRLVPAIAGLPPRVSEDRLKALGAAAASSGSVAMFHAIGSTPEADTLEDALGSEPPLKEIDVTPHELRAARSELTTSRSAGLAAVSVGTPHFSVAEFAVLVDLLRGRRVAEGTPLFVSTGRDVLAAIEGWGWADQLRSAGATIVVDTCTYITPILKVTGGAVMTNSAKWAYYAPGNLGVEVCFGSLRECVESAVRGRIWRDDGDW